MKAIAMAGAMALLMTMTLVGCSGGGTEDPEKAYENLVKAASGGDYGYLYDALDHEMRQGFDSLIQMSFRSRESYAAPERAFWDSVGRMKSRDAFIAVMRSDSAYTAMLRGQYRVVKADTLVVLSIERPNGGELRYFTPEGGSLKVTSAPIAPQSEAPMGMPPGHPGMGGEGMGDPHGGMAPAPGEGTAPDDSIHGGAQGR